MNIEVKTEKPTIPPVKITIGEQTIEMSHEDAKTLCDALSTAIYGRPFPSLGIFPIKSNIAFGGGLTGEIGAQQ